MNLDGEVIGINSMKAAHLDGVSFAIPIDTAQSIINSLIVNKCFVRPYLGLAMLTMERAVDSKSSSGKTGRGLPSTSSSIVVVTEVRKKSPAEQAGIQRYGTIHMYVWTLYTNLTFIRIR